VCKARTLTAEEAVLFAESMDLSFASHGDAAISDGHLTIDLNFVDRSDLEEGLTVFAALKDLDFDCEAVQFRRFDENDGSFERAYIPIWENDYASVS
jgi:hypothetical protein